VLQISENTLGTTDSLLLAHKKHKEHQVCSLEIRIEIASLAFSNVSAYPVNTKSYSFEYQKCKKLQWQVWLR
jgi:hypothetical protein